MINLKALLNKICEEMKRLYSMFATQGNTLSISSLGKNNTTTVNYTTTKPIISCLEIKNDSGTYTRYVRRYQCYPASSNGDYSIDLKRIEIRLINKYSASVTGQYTAYNKQCDDNLIKKA